MKDFANKLAAITGGGTGIGRELARQLAAEGCHLALCDVSAEAMQETRRICLESAPGGTRITTHVADVADETQVLAFRDAATGEHATDHIDLLFNNAGIGGGGSFVNASREEWERTFNVCWGGVYFCTRAFLPLLIASTEAHIVNTSSINGFWASIGYNRAHTAYSAAKFAVKGFTEALINDLRLNAPHVKCSVVMPGHIGTAIVRNTREILTGKTLAQMGPADMAQARASIAASGVDPSKWSDERLRAIIADAQERFETQAPTSAAEAATVILQGVRDSRWRILIGPDAHALDALVRAQPEAAYEELFVQPLRDAGYWKLS